MLWLWLSGCCGGQAPVWTPFEPVTLDGGSTAVSLAGSVTDDGPAPILSVHTDGQVLAEIQGDQLLITPQPAWIGTTQVTLVAEDRCGNRATTLIEVRSGPDSDAQCVTRLRYEGSADLQGVAVAGAFNAWSTEEHPMALQQGAWTLDLELAPGAYPYKLVEKGAFGEEAWTCDPAAPFIHCDAGYIEPTQTDFPHRCEPGAQSCNSLLVVPACDRPALSVADLDVDRTAGAVHVQLVASGTPIAQAFATLDGAPIEAFSPASLSVDLQGLSPGRHTLRFRGIDDEGRASEELYVPVWLDEWEWQDGVMYFAFVDRMQSGRTSNDGGEGATAMGGDYEGGDLRGLLGLLPYLHDLGVDILWLSNMQDNAEGAWDGQCGQTFTGYHAYWPDGAQVVEEHFGNETDLRELVDRAHGLGMRVVMDWVGNHVHLDHPYVQQHPEWFHPYAACDETIDGQLGFDRIPQTCWFAPYLPDVDYARPEALVTMVDDAMWWAKTFELDGLRVDAVKHMSHAVSWNLSSAVDREIEHGGDLHFWTVGETLDGRDRIASYLGADQLSGQFDFPLYQAVRNAFVRDVGDLNDVLESLDASKAAFGTSTMSPFLGNHDFLRFVTESAEGELGACDGDAIRVAETPAGPEPTDRLKLAWTFLFTVPGTPLVYYGDELGLPGHADPDNRQPLWWHVADLEVVDSVESMAARVDAGSAGVVRHVQALAHARRAHPSLRRGTRTEWWREPDLVAYARTEGSDHALVVLNRSPTGRDLSNGLAFAGLPQGSYEDALTGATFVSVGDQITVPVDARGSRVLLWRSP